MTPQTVESAGNVIAPVDILPYIGDQTGGTVAIPSGSGSAPVALPSGTKRLSVVVDVDCFMRLGNGAATATTASAPLKAGLPYDVGVRSTEGYISFYGNGGSGTARWFRLDLI